MVAERERWNRRYREKGTETPGPSALLQEFAQALPERGRALDLAGGVGQNALFFAERGLTATLCDLSDAALCRGQLAADRRALSLICLQIDLEKDPLPRGPWNVVAWTFYHQPELFAPLCEELAPGGLLFFVHPTRKNLDRNARRRLVFCWNLDNSRPLSRTFLLTSSFFVRVGRLTIST